MGPLTPFQLVTEARLLEELRGHGLELEGRKTVDAPEPYVTGAIHDVNIWIYADEACVIGRGCDRVFEKWDYDSGPQLADAFVQEVLRLFPVM